MMRSGAGGRQMDGLAARTGGPRVNGSRPAAVSASDPREARRRIGLLADAGSFQEFGSQARHRVTSFAMAERRPPGDGVITGSASVRCRPVGLFAPDPPVLGA